LSAVLAGTGDADWITAEFPSPMNRTPARSSSSAKQLCMHTCEVCENEYDKAFEIVVGGQRHTFHSFECAIHALAPVCQHCNAESSVTVSKQTDKSSAAFTVHVRPAQRS